MTNLVFLETAARSETADLLVENNDDIINFAVNEVDSLVEEQANYATWNIGQFIGESFEDTYVDTVQPITDLVVASTSIFSNIIANEELTESEKVELIEACSHIINMGDVEMLESLKAWDNMKQFYGALKTPATQALRRGAKNVVDTNTAAAHAMLTNAANSKTGKALAQVKKNVTDTYSTQAHTAATNTSNTVRSAELAVNKGVKNIKDMGGALADTAKSNIHNVAQKANFEYDKAMEKIANNGKTAANHAKAPVSQTTAQHATSRTIHSTTPTAAYKRANAPAAPADGAPLHNVKQVPQNKELLTHHTSLSTKLHGAVNHGKEMVKDAAKSVDQTMSGMSHNGSTAAGTAAGGAAGAGIGAASGAAIGALTKIFSKERKAWKNLVKQEKEAHKKGANEATLQKIRNAKMKAKAEYIKIRNTAAKKGAKIGGAIGAVGGAVGGGMVAHSRYS